MSVQKCELPVAIKLINKQRVPSQIETLSYQQIWQVLFVRTSYSSYQKHIYKWLICLTKQLDYELSLHLFSCSCVCVLLICLCPWLCEFPSIQRPGEDDKWLLFVYVCFNALRQTFLVRRASFSLGWLPLEILGSA